MARKNVRELKVCAQSGYNYKSVPAIRLMGQWLEDAGFHIGDPVSVRCEDGKLIITPDTARAELIEAEKVFMEKETRKLHESFMKEKKELRAQFVAERQAVAVRQKIHRMDARDLALAHGGNLRRGAEGILDDCAKGLRRA